MNLVAPTVFKSSCSSSGKRYDIWQFDKKGGLTDESFAVRNRQEMFGDRGDGGFPNMHGE
jgi:hypothetical protein